MFIAEGGDDLPSSQTLDEFCPKEEVYTALETKEAKVSDLETFMSSLLFPYLRHRVKPVSAGHISQCLKNWEKITPDPYILESVTGDIIVYDSVPKPQISYPPNSVSKQHILFIQQDIKHCFQRILV